MPVDCYASKNREICEILDDLDTFVLYQLYIDEPSHCLKSYVDLLVFFTGTLVSKSTISRFGERAFHIKASLRKRNLFPYGKLKPENLLRAEEYLELLMHISPTRLRFADENLLKGSELYNRKAQRDPLTGLVPPTYTDRDFRNTYSIVGICSIDTSTYPLYYRIHTGKNDSDSFSYDVEQALATGFLKRNSVLVMDNAAIHCGGENTDLEEWLYERHGVYVLFLPTRTPEWNPIELVWRHFCTHLRIHNLKLARELKTHAAAIIAGNILDDVRHAIVSRCFELSDVYKFYYCN